MEGVRDQIRRLVARQQSGHRLPSIMITARPGPARVWSPTSASFEPTRRRAVRPHQLCGHPRRAPRGRVVRLRAGRLHRRAPAEGRPVPDRPPRHHLPRRGGPAARGASGQAPQGPRGARGTPAGRHPQRALRRLGALRHQRRPHRCTSRAAVSRGSLSSAGRPHADPSPDPRTRRGRRAARRALSCPGLRRLRAASEDDLPGRPRRAHGLSVAGQRAAAGQRDGARRPPRRRQRRDPEDARLAAGGIDRRTGGRG